MCARRTRRSGGACDLDEECTAGLTCVANAGVAAERFVERAPGQTLEDGGAILRQASGIAEDISNIYETSIYETLCFALLAASLSLAVPARANDRREDRATSVDPLIHRAAWLLDRLPNGHRLRATLPPVTDGRVAATLRADRVLSAVDRRQLGIEFERRDGRVVRVGRVYPVSVPLSRLADLAADPRVQWLETAWRPFEQSTLDLAGAQVQAHGLAAQGYAATGQAAGAGIVVGNMDTGVDVSHPGLMVAGRALAWVDEDGDGSFDPAVDTLRDYEGSSRAALKLPLAFVDADLHHSSSILPFGPINPASLEPLDGAFDARFDWLYHDADGSGTPQWPATSFFVLDDLDGDGEADPLERFLELSGSKIVGVHAGGQELTTSEAYDAFDSDAVFHGTGSSGILLGGHPGAGRYTGLAPAARMLLLARGGLTSQDIVQLDWARARGMDVLLIEFGRWFMQFQDGSSNLETAIDALAEDGIVTIAPSGNLGSRGKHIVVQAEKGYTDVPFEVPGFYSDTGEPQNIGTVILTLLWRTPKAGLHVEVIAPGGAGALFMGLGSSSVTTDEGWMATGDAATSSRGTGKLDIILTQPTADGVVPYGEWTLRLGNPKHETLEVWGRIADDVSSWNGGARYLQFVTDLGTLSYPSTADSAISVGAYGGRFAAAGDSGPGKLRVYSGRGPRIDGVNKLDVTAPDDSICIGSGKTLGKTLPYGGYQVFGGTSGAGPHVAAGAAILLQQNPGLSPEAVRELIRAGALWDPGMGQIPSTGYGFGKLRLMSGAEPSVTPAPLDVAIEVLTEGPGLERRLRVVALGAAAFRWDDTYDGAWDTQLTPEPERLITFEAEGRYAIKAQAVDTDGAIGYAVLELDVTDIPAPPEPDPGPTTPPEPPLAGDESAPPAPAAEPAETPVSNPDPPGGCAANQTPKTGGPGLLLLLLLFLAAVDDERHSRTRRAGLRPDPGQGEASTAHGRSYRVG